MSAEGRLILQGTLRGALKDDDSKELLLDEWSVGPYFREIELPVAVDGPAGTLTYGNGVVVVALPVAPASVPGPLAPPGGSAAAGKPR